MFSGSIAQEFVETNITNFSDEIKIILRGCDGDREEYWENPMIRTRFKKYISPELAAVMRANGCIFKCEICKTNLCSLVHEYTPSLRVTAYLCSTCVTLCYPGNNVEDVVVGEGRDAVWATKSITYGQIYRIIRQRRRQKSIRALLTLLNGLNQHRLPHDLIRTLKQYLY